MRFDNSILQTVNKDILTKKERDSLAKRIMNLESRFGMVTNKVDEIYSIATGLSEKFDSNKLMADSQRMDLDGMRKMNESLDKMVILLEKLSLNSDLLRKRPTSMPFAA